MNQQYKDARNFVQQLEFKVRDLIDDKTHPAGQKLLSSTKQLVYEFDAQRNPRSIEDKVKSILDTLENIRSSDQIMDFRHTDHFIAQYEHVQMSLRNFENY